MTYNLLYIDDDPNAMTFADGFNTTGLIKVTTLKPTSFEAQINELITSSSSYHGLILDLKLDENLSGERRAYYLATALATHIRSKVREGEWKPEVPIILFTTQQKKNAIFTDPHSGQELFDAIFTKESITDSSLQIKIHAIVEAYHFIEKSKPSFEKILGLESLLELDKRIFSNIANTEKATQYAFLQLILSNIICRPGLLISESLLLSRLGIDKSKSPNWYKLKELLKTCKYSGVLSNAWERWWMHRLNEWWESNFQGNSLASLDARDRVEKINEKFSLGLKVAEPIAKCSSYRYWTICEGYEKPLDPREGFRISEVDPLPWQDTRYISFEAIVERKKRTQGLKIHPIEKDRFENIKKALFNGN